MRGKRLALVLALACLAALDATVFITPVIASAARELDGQKFYTAIMFVPTAEPLYVQIADSTTEDVFRRAGSVWGDPRVWHWDLISWRSRTGPEDQRLYLRDGAGKLRFCLMKAHASRFGEIDFSGVQLFNFWDVTVVAEKAPC